MLSQVVFPCRYHIWLAHYGSKYEYTAYLGFFEVTCLSNSLTGTAQCKSDCLLDHVH